MNIGSLFVRHARYRPDHQAVVFKDRRLSYFEFNQHTNRLANALLDLGLKKGDKVATILHNSVELLEIFFASAKIGAVVVPLSTLLREQALETLLKDSNSALLVTESSFVPLVDKIRSGIPGIAPDRYLLCDGKNIKGYQDFHRLKAAARDGEPDPAGITFEDPFDIMYSSGTTGLPKGIIHTHGVRAWYAATFASSYRMTPESVTLHAGAIVFNGAFVDLMSTFYLGATYILLPQFDPQEFIAAIEREKATHIIVVPAQVIALLEAPNFSAEALDSLEMILSLGAPLHRKHKEELTRLLPDRFYELYGLTEGFVTVLDKKDYRRKPGSVGVPPSFFEMKIMDDQNRELPPGEVGEICGRGPILTPGYYGRPDLTDQAIVDGWLHSGDMGRVDEDGFLYLVDRKKDMILSGGVNVYPRDIEEVVVKNPLVREAAVFGIPDEKWGESPLAAVILKEPGAASPEELKDWINQRVEAKFQRVKEVLIMDDFPRNAAGKTLKRTMRQPYWRDREGNI